MIRVYGIPNCDTVKKARAWLDGHGVGHEFVDFRKQPPPVSLVASWIASLGRDRVVNRRGTTWRRLDQVAQASADTDAGAAALLAANPSAIRRPVVEIDGGWLIGFDTAEYERTFG
ncbi:MAG: Spx/MgsR family RNA polymerase-binding regulatory protein [Betaproteobacteria bacterium]|nr:Spx/MgsR family RNA polymerase-binding regulatory protein [Betaproteobacteria bacterium]